MAKKSANTLTPQAVTVRVNRRPLALALVVLAATIAGWFVFTAPARHDAAAATDAVDSARQSLAADQATLSGLKSGQARSADALFARSSDLDKLLPTRTDRVALVGRVDQLAHQAGVNLALMNPTTDLPNGPGVVSQFDVNVTGPAAGLGTFLGSLSNEQPLMTIAALTVSGDGGQGQPGSSAEDVSASFTLQVWSAPSLPELGQSATPGATSTP